MAKESILVVDDEPTILRLCERMLAKEGYRVRTASCGEEGLQLAGQEPFDLLLTDILMPGMDGLQLIEAIRTIDPQLPAVIITGHGHLETAIEALKRGAQGFVLKPFTAEELKGALSLALEKTRLARENARLKALLPIYQVAQAYMDRTEEDAFLRTLLETAARETQAQEANIMLLDRDGEVLTQRDGIPFRAGESVGLGEGIEGWVAQEGKPLVLPDGDQPSAMMGAIGENPPPTACLPVIVRGRVIGTLTVRKEAFRAPFVESDVELLSILAETAAVTVENARLYKEMEETFMSTLAALANALEVKDLYTRGHADRMAEYAVAIGRAMGLSEREVEPIRLGALFHDIGKIGVPDLVLRKEGRLNDEELAVMQEHPLKGVEIIGPIRRLREALPILMHHHERYDGGGYPGGLAGDQIPLGSRIVAVADSFEAMTSNRPYRLAMSAQAAREELRKGAGTQFDPQVVEAALQVLGVDQI